MTIAERALLDQRIAGTLDVGGLLRERPWLT